MLYRHPAVLEETAVVTRPDDKWGEVPCAFVTLRADAPDITEADLIAYCRGNMAHFKAPKLIIFGQLPKTSTGKVQKYVLREHPTAPAPRTLPKAIVSSARPRAGDPMTIDGP